MKLHVKARQIRAKNCGSRFVEHLVAKYAYSSQYSLWQNAANGAIQELKKGTARKML